MPPVYLFLDRCLWLFPDRLLKRATAVVVQAIAHFVGSIIIIGFQSWGLRTKALCFRGLRALAVVPLADDSHFASRSPVFRMTPDKWICFLHSIPNNAKRSLPATDHS